jgi:hypothetical protein
MNKVYRIETRCGWAILPEKIGTFQFPLSFGSFQGATTFPSKLFAEKSLRAFHLDKNPYHAHIEEFIE